MDIAMLSMVNNQNKINNSASLLMLKKAMEVSNQNANNMQKIIKEVPHPDPNLGNNFDKRA